MLHTQRDLYLDGSTTRRYVASFTWIAQLHCSPHFTPPSSYLIRKAFCPTNSYCPTFPAPVLQPVQLHPLQQAVCQRSLMYPSLQSHVDRGASFPYRVSSSMSLPPASMSLPPAGPPSERRPVVCVGSVEGFSRVEEVLDYRKCAAQLRDLRTRLGYSAAEVGSQIGALSHTLLSGGTVSSFESGQMPLNVARQIQPFMRSWAHHYFDATKERRPVQRTDEKRPRVILDARSKMQLEDSFKKNSNPLPRELLILSETLSLDSKSIKKWFCNRRRREKLKSTQGSEKGVRVIPSSSHDITLEVEGQPGPCQRSLPVYIDQPPN